MDRRLFLRLTGFVAAASAFRALPVAAQGHTDEVPLNAPGTYQISGRVRLENSLVTITGITNAQQISWADMDRRRPPVAGFTSFEHFPEPWRMPDIQVSGGRLEQVAVVPIDLG
jgi:hypothetical protein